ncbi:hypothetical protein [Mesorhizobium sp. B2-3-4]|uniref:hypothetical protein n=1 Tax=Mesorhizobium sp. B2-3-4 TaxID=2589959 RepID=UPI00112B3584|nr:hypothetical protein [Mesorhizobium sp. B2-3-4]TPM41401.1 hypothetical protein FJ967_00240 [Mesorhizobium sp. B2-3-4]
MTEFDTLKAEWIAAEQAVLDAYTAAKALWKRVKTLRRKAKKARERFRAAWYADMKTNERTNNEETHQG